MNQVVDCRYGRMIVNPNDVYLGRMLLEYGEFSEGEVELFRNVIQPGMTVLDVGANIGAHTLPLAQLAERVIAFEPQRDLYHMLCGMCALNDLHNVTCVNAAVGAQPGAVPIYQVDTTQKNNMGSGSLLDMQDSPECIACVTVDVPFQFMKVDVEGMELDVLKGARDMILEHRPALYVENDREARADELIDYIDGLGYACYWHAPSFFNPRNFRGNQADLFPGMGSINMLCVDSRVNLEGLERAKTGEWARRWTVADSWRKVA